MAPIQQIGTELVKVYSNGKKVITEALGNGRTLTKIFNADGSLILERTKSVSGLIKKNEGNVIRIDRIVKDASGLTYQNESERLYNIVNGKNVLTGSRDRINGRNNVLIPNNDGTNQAYMSLSNRIGTLRKEFFAICKIQGRNVLDRAMTGRWGAGLSKTFDQGASQAQKNVQNVKNESVATAGLSELWF